MLKLAQQAKLKMSILRDISQKHQQATPPPKKQQQHKTKPTNKQKTNIETNNDKKATL